MTTQYVQPGDTLQVTAASRTSGDVVVAGSVVGVAQGATDSAGVVQVGTKGVYALYVEAIDDAGNSAVAIGDDLYASASGDQGSAATVLSKKASGTYFGTALAAVTAGEIGQINVKIGPVRGNVPKQQLAGGFLKAKIIAGGAAGDLTVTGIAAGDELVAVTRFDLDATAGNIDVDDLTSEFTIDGADTINNDGGTNTTGDKLQVIYLDLT
jgi:predicted RecA/RadA family phage recombinase